MNKYRIISLEPLQPMNNRRSIKNMAELRPRTLSVRCPTTNLQLQPLFPSNPTTIESRKTNRKMSAMNTKQRPQLVSSKYSKRS